MSSTQSFCTPPTASLFTGVLYGALFAVITSVGGSSLAPLNLLGLAIGAGGAVAYYMRQVYTVGNGVLLQKTGFGKKTYPLPGAIVAVAQVACKGG